MRVQSPNHWTAREFLIVFLIKKKNHKFKIWFMKLVCAWSLSQVWLFLTPWTVACQAPLCMKFFRQEYWSGLPFPPGDLPNPGIEPAYPVLLHWQADSLLLSHLGSLASNLENYKLNFPQVIILHMQLESCRSKNTLLLLLLSRFSHVRLWVTP